jgi:hypothetical protein
MQQPVAVAPAQGVYAYAWFFAEFGEIGTERRRWRTDLMEIFLAHRPVRRGA